MDRARKKMINDVDEFLYLTDIYIRIELFNIMAMEMGQENTKDYFYEEGAGIRILYDNIQTPLLFTMVEFLEKKCGKYLLIL